MKALSLSLKQNFIRSSSSNTMVADRSKKQHSTLPTKMTQTASTSTRIATPAPTASPSPSPSPTPNKPQSSKSAASKSNNGSKHINNDLLLNGIGPYQFLHTLGNGKFSKVMLAKHRETRQLVAIKIIDKQAHDYRVMSRLVREIHLMELFDHPNIVKLYETYETCDSLFLVMEYVAGYNLDEYLQQRGGVLSETEARHLFRQLVQAVHTCHRHWVVHRDLKTPNIMISKDQRRKVKGDNGVDIEVPVLKLADFGLGNRFGLQRLRTICGSMLYYSPEIISNQKYYGPEVDCWCLGVALFRMTAGFEPFAHAHTVGELKRDVCSCNFPMPASLGPELQNTILKCLQIDRRRRMTVRHALHNDPWLTKNGELPCPLETPTIYDDLIQTQQQEGNELTAKDKERRTRRQLMKTLEQEQPQAKRTIIYHPINPSTYFTTVALDTAQSSSSSAAITNTPAKQSSLTLEVPTVTDGNNNNAVTTSNSATTTSSHRYDRHIVNVESHRSELLQSIRQKSCHLGLTSTEKWQKMIMIRPQQLLQLKSAFSSHSRTDLEATDGQSQPSTKGFSWAQMMQRIQDQIYYFQLDYSLPSVLASINTPFSSSSSLLKQNNASAASHHQELAGAEGQTKSRHGSSTFLMVQEPPLPSLTLSSVSTTGSIEEPLDSSSSCNNNNHFSSNCSQQQQPSPQNQKHHQHHIRNQEQGSNHSKNTTSITSLNTYLDKECMELLKQTCQLMGITYHQDGPKRLVCVLTLRDSPQAPEQASQQQQQQQRQQQQQQTSLQRRSSKHSTASTQRSSTSTSTSNTSRSNASRRSNSYEELILGGGGTYPKNASSTRFQMPLISHLTSSMATSFFGRVGSSNKQKQSSSSASVDHQRQQQQQQQHQQGEKETGSNKKDGVAVFTVTWETLLSPSSIPLSSSATSSSSSISSSGPKFFHQHHIVALRFSKLQGSTTVFKMAGGWITGVMGLEGKLSSNNSKQ